MVKAETYQLAPDNKGIIWDLLLYIPVVTGLAILSFMFWYQPNHGLAYLTFFGACFFFYQAVGRILGKLLLLPSAPISLSISKKMIVLQLKNGSQVELVKNLRYYSDYAGKSFAIKGMDTTGAMKSYIFHKGQFSNNTDYQKVGGLLKVYA